MASILVTGFTPFDGRACNASYIAAASLVTRGVRVHEVPVIWGSPFDQLSKLCTQHCPTTIISLGEGREGWFDFESVALNRRLTRLDNAGNLPEPASISASGPAIRHSTCDLAKYQRGLTDQGFPVRISSDAGQFLCEEMLYTLESLKSTQSELEEVLFCHVPPFGTRLTVGGKNVSCDSLILASFAGHLLDIAVSS